MVNHDKAGFFKSGAQGYKIPHYLPKEKAEEWKKDYSLCDCSTCYDGACIYRQKDSRFPEDAGGQNQCLRYMRQKTPYVWRNGDGLVIEIPAEVVEVIREKRSEESPGD